MARTNGIESLSLKELTELHAKVQDAINTRRKTDLVETKAKMAQLAAEAGFSLEELIGKADGRKGPRSAIPVKFRNPDNPDETWTGRGRQPRWLVAKLAKRGVTVDDFRI